MSKRLIYAEDAIEALSESLKGVFVAYEDIAKKTIDKVPSAQPEQPQPCKDAVSKADVLETYAELYDVFDDNKEIKNELHKIYDKINALQTAQPQRMKGRWTKAYDGYDGHVKCVQCFKTYDWDTQAQYYNFCPNCGADMKGEQDG